MSDIFLKDDLRIELARRMGWYKLDAELQTVDPDFRQLPTWHNPEGNERVGCAFYPMTNVADDYSVLVWMKQIVQYKYPDTYRDFIGMVSGAMWQYVVGDYAKGAMCAIGIIDTKSK